MKRIFNRKFKAPLSDTAYVKRTLYAISSITVSSQRDGSVDLTNFTGEVMNVHKDLVHGLIKQLITLYMDKKK